MGRLAQLTQGIVAWGLAIHRAIAAVGASVACRTLSSIGLAIAIGVSGGALDQAFAANSSASSFPKPKGGIFGPQQKLDKTQPLYLQGDELIYDTKGNSVTARGNVEIYYNNNILTADEVVYDQNANTLTAAGNVVLKDPNGNIIRADRYTLTDDFRDGFVQSLSIVTKDETRISAEQASRREGNITEFRNGRFTPCKAAEGMPPLWCLSAASIVHDQQAGTITYQDAQFELLGVPILYLPYFQHADPSTKRKSGFLVPEVGTSSTLGTTVEVPYYFALSPSYDFTFHPLYTSEQGVLWQGDWRQRLANGQFTVKFAAIDQDADDLPSTTENRDDYDGWRGSLETKGQFSLASWWKLGWDVTLESDDAFRRFYKLDSVLLTDRINNVYLTGQSERNYFAVNLYHFGGLLLDDTPQSESLVHPIIDHNYVFSDPVAGGELSVTSNALSFSRSDVDGNQEYVTRAITEVKWRRRLTDQIGITYTPFAELRGDAYQLSDYIDPVTGVLVADDTVVRGLATGGATVAYPWAAATPDATHVIEPIGQIVARQRSVDQRQLPNEDANSLIFDDTNLFDTSKFSGYDRLETGTRTNVGLQYTFQSNTGGYARILAGQSFHLSGDNIYANPGTVGQGNFIYSPSSGLETDRSDYVVGAYLAPSDIFRVISQSRFDESDLALRQENLAAQLHVGPLLAQATYSYIAQDPEFADSPPLQEIIGLVGLKLTNQWSLQGSLRYDLEEGQRLTDMIQLRYGDDCFVLTATYAESFIDDPNSQIVPDRSVMLRFELKHLGQFGYKTDVLDYASSDQP